MNIVVEGPDASGKTTLIGKLAPLLGLSVVKSEGPCVDIHDFRQRCQQLYSLKNVIFDRHCHVSEPIYGYFAKRYDTVDYSLIALIRRNPPLYIYCRGPATLDRHVADHSKDSPEHLAMIERHHSEIRYSYERWANANAHIWYTIGDERSGAPEETAEERHRRYFLYLVSLINHLKWETANGFRPVQGHHRVPREVRIEVRRSASSSSSVSRSVPREVHKGRVSRVPVLSLPGTR